MKGEFEKRLQPLTSYAIRYSLTPEEHIKVNEILAQIRRINEKNIGTVLDEARKEFYELLKKYRSDFNFDIEEPLEGVLNKWFGESIKKET